MHFILLPHGVGCLKLNEYPSNMGLVIKAHDIIPALCLRQGETLKMIGEFEIKQKK